MSRTLEDEQRAVCAAAALAQRNDAAAARRGGGCSVKMVDLTIEWWSSSLRHEKNAANVKATYLVQANDTYPSWYVTVFLSGAQ